MKSAEAAAAPETRPELKISLLAKKWREERNLWISITCFTLWWCVRPAPLGVQPMGVQRSWLQGKGRPACPQSPSQPPLLPRARSPPPASLLTVLFAQVTYLVALEEKHDELEDENADLKGLPRPMRTTTSDRLAGALPAAGFPAPLGAGAWGLAAAGARVPALLGLRACMFATSAPCDTTPPPFSLAGAINAAAVRVNETRAQAQQRMSGEAAPAGACSVYYRSSHGRVLTLCMAAEGLVVGRLWVKAQAHSTHNRLQALSTPRQGGSRTPGTRRRSA